MQPGTMLVFLNGVHAEVAACLPNGQLLLRALPQQGVTTETLAGLGWIIYRFPLPRFLGGGRVYRIVAGDVLEALMATGSVRELSAAEREASRPQRDDDAE